MPSFPGLHARLREATGAAHAELESALALLEPPPLRDRFVALLQRFHAFHRQWEPALASRLQDPAFTGPRRRVHLIEHDLRRLGGLEAALDAVPACPEAARLCETLEGALGSLYVLEGSTLGGRVISRRMQGAAWWPEGGLRYFDPYGEHTGARWRDTLARIEAGGGDDERVVQGAVHTFACLRDWLAPAPSPVTAAEAV